MTAFVTDDVITAFTTSRLFLLTSATKLTAPVKFDTNLKLVAWSVETVALWVMFWTEDVNEKVASALVITTSVLT